MFALVLAYLAAIAAQPTASTLARAEATYHQAERLKAVEPLQARTLYEASARQGYAPAQSALGILLFKDGNRTGALRWLKKAADAGEPRALLLYGTALFNGDGVPPDPAGGYAMVRRAAAKGLPQAGATQSEMELVLPASERDAATTRLAAIPPAPDVAHPPKEAARTVAKAKPALRKEKGRRKAESKPAPTPTSGAWRIQLGAFRQPGAGQALFARLAPRLPGKRASYISSGGLTRLMVGPYESLAQASAACRALGQDQACIPTKS